MTESTKDLRWSVEQRLEFIEFRLYWEGQIRRGDLQQRFDISTPQATTDLNRYQKIAPGNLIYDMRRSTYVPTDHFKPVMYEPDARDYLAELRLIADNVVTPEIRRLGFVPPFDVVPLVRRRASEARLRKVLRAIRVGRAVYIRYQSISRDEPMWRWITPHAMVFDGFRWHARSWCHRRKAFRDFVLARMLEVDKDKDHEIDVEADREWHEYVSLEIGPNPKLSKAAQKAIELDYGMKDGTIDVSCRVCLSWYVERHLGLDLDPEKIDPNRQQIVLRNLKEIEQKREATKKAAANAAAALAST